MASIYINGVNICASISNCEIEDPNAIEEDLNELPPPGVEPPLLFVPLPPNADLDTIDTPEPEPEPEEIVSDWTTAANIDQSDGSASQAEPRFYGVPSGSTPMYFLVSGVRSWEWKLSETALSAPYMVVDVFYELDTGYVYCRVITWTSNLYGDPLYAGSITVPQYAKNVTSDLTCIDGVISGTVVLKAVTVPADGDLTLIFS